MMFPDKADPYRSFLGWKITQPIPHEDLDRALSNLEMILKPIPDAECDELLTLVKLATIRQQASAEEFAMQLGLYRSELRAYPADVVRKVLTDWRRQNDFWPTLKALFTIIEPLSRKRFSLKLKLIEERERGVKETG